MSKYKDFLIVPLYRYMYNPKGECMLTTIRAPAGDRDGVLLVVVPLWQQFLLAILTMMRKSKETSMIRKEFQLVLWSWISIPVWYQIYATGKGVMHVNSVPTELRRRTVHACTVLYCTHIRI